MQDLKLFWQWLRTKPNGTEWADVYEPTSWLSSRVRAEGFPLSERDKPFPQELMPVYQQWLKSVAPGQRLISADREDALKTYEGRLTTHFKRLVKEGAITYDEYLTRIAEIQSIMDDAKETGKPLTPDFPYFNESVNLVEDWAYDIQQRQKREMEAWEEKKKKFEEGEATRKLKEQAEQAKFEVTQQAGRRVVEERETKQRGLDQIRRQVSLSLPNLPEKAYENIATLMQRIWQGQPFQEGEILPVSEEAQGDVAQFLEEYSVERVMKLLEDRTLPAGLTDVQKRTALTQTLTEADFKGKERISFGGAPARQALGQEFQAQGLAEIQKAEQARKEAKAKLVTTGAGLPVEQRMELQRQARTPETAQEAVVASAQPLFQKAEALGVGGAGVPFDVEKQTEQAREQYWQFLQKSYPGKNINLAFRQFPLIFQDFQNEWLKPRTRPGGEGILAVGQFVPYLEEKGREYLSPYIGERTPIVSPKRRRGELGA